MNLITTNSKVMGGTPVITGTRIPISTIVYLHKKLKKSPETIATEYYTQLSVDQIINVLKWFDSNGDKNARLDI